MKNCNSICLNGEALKIDIENNLGYAIRLENDANCFALSEAHYGAAKDSKSMFGVIIGTGTGKVGWWDCYQQSTSNRAQQHRWRMGTLTPYQARQEN